MMKEFEKWRNEQKISGRSYKADARVWRAALEMILKKMKDKTTSYTQIHIDVEQELGDT